MAILIFILSLILLIGAAASGYQSLNLLPTGIGVLYALAGAAAACAAVLTFAIAILIPSPVLYGLPLGYPQGIPR